MYVRVFPSREREREPPINNGSNTHTHTHITRSLWLCASVLLLFASITDMAWIKELRNPKINKENTTAADDESNNSEHGRRKKRGFLRGFLVVYYLTTRFNTLSSCRDLTWQLFFLPEKKLYKHNTHSHTRSM